MNRVHLKTYGCQMNERDSEAVAAMLRARGYRIVPDEDDCDILLMNTCSVRDLAEQKAIGKAQNLAARKKRQPDFILGILGCMAQNRGASLLDQLPDLDLIIGTQKFHQVPGYLDNLRAARAAGLPIAENPTIVDIAEEAGSQNTIRDHLLLAAEDGGGNAQRPTLNAQRSTAESSASAPAAAGSEVPTLPGSSSASGSGSDAGSPRSALDSQPGAASAPSPSESGSQRSTLNSVLGAAAAPSPSAAAAVAPQVTAFVSIQQGCNMDCAFCIVPKTRGDERSRPMDDIVRECEQLVARGVREITLLGQIVTSYGRRDYAHTGGLSPFVQLLERVHAVEGLARIRFTSPHPRGFKQDLADAYTRLPKLCPYVHLPLQSGSDRILRAMNRPYSRERYLEIVASLRAARPEMFFSTDIIVGFPGETEADFADTADLFRRADYDMAYIFKYSIRSGTPAATLEDQVPDEVKEARNQHLLQLLEENSRRRTATLVGTTQEVLVEGPDKKGRSFIGRTPGNRLVHFAATPRLIGQLVPVRITRATSAVLYGDLELAGVEPAALAAGDSR